MSSTSASASSVPPRSGPAPVRGVELASPRALRWQRFAMSVAVVLPLAGVAAALWWGWGRGVSGVDVGLLLGFYFFTGLGITVGFHRLFTHQSFRVPQWVRVLFAVAGSMAIQGAVIDWVATHRRHHAYSDRPGDPHSPHVAAGDGLRGMLKGLWFAHTGWMLGPEKTVQQAWAPDLLKDRAIVRVSRAFPWLILASFALPALLGGLLTMSFAGALTGFLWGGLVRVFLLHHVTWSINSICHVFGTRPWAAHDESRNNPVMALIGFGEGWHNGHHAFPASARHGLRWWEFDISWVVIRGMQKLRLARDIKLPSSTQLARRTRSRA
ncbi:acyl-CoA desaturase [Egicoccus halophilus]|uniref:Stearoyl-CoA desaturase n=1 Tax=Egicoccus halophilus TaxID=1670830 RepID=A0A8J3ABY5_9ACTN|nr:acyl-CoA desaturase [Egicoccus halophilus]GGI07924.1 stearoyl-CoA desaturase [Egicoccus halophilus]